MTVWVRVSGGEENEQEKDREGKRETNIAKWGKMHGAFGAKGQRRHGAQSSREARKILTLRANKKRKYLFQLFMLIG